MPKVHLELPKLQEMMSCCTSGGAANTGQGLRTQARWFCKAGPSPRLPLTMLVALVTYSTLALLNQPK